MNTTNSMWKSQKSMGDFERIQFGSSTAGGDHDNCFFIAIRRVVLPSLSDAVNRAVRAAAAVSQIPHEAGAIAGTLFSAAHSLPKEACRALAERQPQEIGMLIKNATRLFVPLQLLGAVPCIRVYAATLPRAIARAMRTQTWPFPDPPDPIFYDGERLRPGVALQCADFLWSESAEPWSASDETIIRDRVASERGFKPLRPSERRALIEAVRSLPGLSRDLLLKVPDVSKEDADEMIAAIMRAALGDWHGR